jgi:hypothetical protein
MPKRSKQRCARYGALAVLATASLLAPLRLHAQNESGRMAIYAAAAAPTNVAVRDSRVPQGVPIPTPEKRKAGFLAGAGLAILSLLALAAGLALVRAFKR